MYAKAKCLRCMQVIELSTPNELKQCICGEIYIMSSSAVDKVWGNSLRPNMLEWIQKDEN